MFNTFKKKKKRHEHDKEKNGKHKKDPNWTYRDKKL